MQVSLIVFISTIMGFLFPFLSRRPSKFMPADAATAAVMFCHLPRFPRGINKNHKKRFKKLWFDLIKGSILCGAVCGLITFFFMFKMPFYQGIFISLLCLIMVFMALIDARFQIIPDFFTVPLLIMGIAFANFDSYVDVNDSILGALFGYGAPTLAGVLISWRTKRAIGGGDVKLLAALGAWFGIIGLNFIVFVSVLLFGFYSFLTKQKYLPYGPFAAIAVIGTAIMQFGFDIIPLEFILATK
ncbi:MAG: A24 family peptidase [Alphaproteobacteria bacterium]